MLKLNTEAIAKNFVADQTLINRVTLVGAYESNKCERTARKEFVGVVEQMNTSRLLVLTKNISDEDFQQQITTLGIKRNELTQIIWPQ